MNGVKQFLLKVISEKGGAFLVPRKIQMDSSKNNGNAADSYVISLFVSLHWANLALR